MKKLGKKAITRIFKFAILVLAVILLFFLIKNSWNVPSAFKNMLSLLGIK
ncbi:hypothetical protein KY347_05540 [Candidatus Woesearchaeota archaeon]|nr:hypothetical protein [Candidatus Woesearchaeota archaeon]